MKYVFQPTVHVQLRLILELGGYDAVRIGANTNLTGSTPILSQLPCALIYRFCSQAPHLSYGTYLALDISCTFLMAAFQF